MKPGWVYIVTNRPNGTLYLGVTSDLARRVHEHRKGLLAGFTRTHGLKRLVCTNGMTRSRPRSSARLR